MFRKKHADITHIQTGAEREAGKPGQPYSQFVADRRDEREQRDAAHREVDDLRRRSDGLTSFKDVQAIYHKHGLEFG